MTASERSGRIITFYSYKGGTGRSMALANVAWILASQNQRVLAVDWDLEAPGLHRYFQPFIGDSELCDSPGIVDFLAAFVDGAHSERARKDPRWFDHYTDTEPYTFSLDWKFQGTGTLDLIPAGQQGPSYAPRVTDFEWRKFYDNLGGGTFLQAVKARWRTEYDWVLIDSRTGISDTSGICSVQMPDDLVVCFTLNNQSIKGASAVASSVLDQRRKPDGSAGLRVFPLVTRVERAEHLRLSAAMDLAIGTFDPFLVHLPEEQRKVYFGNAQIHYQPFYAYEEVLAAFGDPPGGPMLSAMEKVSAIVTDGRVSKLGAMSEPDRLEGLARFLRRAKAAEPNEKNVVPQQAPLVETRAAVERPPLPQAPIPINEAPRPMSSLSPSGSATLRLAGAQSYKYWFYLSFSRANQDAYLERFINDLRAELRSVTGIDEDAAGFVDPLIGEGEPWSRKLTQAIAVSRVSVCLYSPAYFRSVWCGREFSLFYARSQLSSQGSGLGMLPILWVPTEVTGLAATLQYATGSDEYSRKGLKQMLQRGRRGGYQEWLYEFAKRLAHVGKSNPLPVIEPLDPELVPNAFEAQASAADVRARTATFLFIAPTLDGPLPADGQSGGATYGSLPQDWRPFGGKTIAAIAEGVAADSELMIRMPVGNVGNWSGNQLINVIRDQDDASPILLVVDVKAFSIGPYWPLLQELLFKLNESRFFNLMVIVVATGRHLERLPSGWLDTNRDSRRVLAVVESDDKLGDHLRQSLAALRVSMLSSVSQRSSQAAPVPPPSPPTKKLT